MELQPGTYIGPYRILAPLGAGGMGEVYRAHDPRLGREVAVKIVRDLASSDSDRLRRFAQEARAVSALNHPNVMTVYDSGAQDSRPYLVTELLDGEALSSILSRGPLSVRRAIDYATQTARGLAAAHAKGIVHRDLKPANLFVTADGRVKIVDFGLAKLLDAEPAANRSRETAPGVLLGTVGYASPEQLRGLPTDARMDLFALGAILYEMLSGTPAFTGSAPEVMSAILDRDPPDLGTEGRSIPAALDKIVRRCLEKQPERRFHSAHDLAFQLENVSSDSAPVPMRRPTSRGRRTVLRVLVTAVAGGIAGWFLHSLVVTRDRPRAVRVQRLTDMVGLEEGPAISPDGKTVAFVGWLAGKRQIYVRLLAGGTPLAVTAGDVDHFDPRWSPDSASLIYYTPGALPENTGTLWEIPALGGHPQRLVNALGPGDLSHDGERLAFFRSGSAGLELAVANRDGSGARVVEQLPPGLFSNPRWSPDDRRIAYIHEAGGQRFSNNVMIVDAAGGTAAKVAGDFYIKGMTWLGDGSGLVVASAEGSLMSYPPTYSLWTVSTDGTRRSQLTFGEASYESPDLGAQGDLVVSRVRGSSDLWKFPVDGVPAENARRGVRVTRQTGLLQTASASPDESEVVLLSDNGGHANVWVARVADGVMRPLTREADPRVVVAVPVWSPRGDWINFLSTRGSGTPDVTLWVVKPDGSDARDLGVFGVWACWSPEGDWLYYTQLEDRYRIWKRRLADGVTLAVRDDNATGCSVAPDGSTLYYSTARPAGTGGLDFEVRVASPENGPSRVLGRVSGSRVPATAVNFHALLSPDGKWLGMPLLDGPTTNIWALSTTDGEWRKLVEFGERNTMIGRRVAWSRDVRHIYASVTDVDADVVMLRGFP